jgi:hypothetical protein
VVGSGLVVVVDVGGGALVVVVAGDSALTVVTVVDVEDEEVDDVADGMLGGRAN